MGALYGMKCDFCGRKQTAEKPSDIKGHQININSVCKYACEVCFGVFKVAFESGRKGIENPLQQVSRLTRERDAALAELSRLKGPWTAALPSSVRPKIRERKITKMGKKQ